MVVRDASLALKEGCGKVDSKDNSVKASFVCEFEEWLSK